jgi:putative ABC transport system permease protein
VNVLGRNITATVANLRSVDWQSLGINFVMVFSPSTFRGAPHTDIATLTFAGGSSAAEEVALLKAAAETFPAVTTVRVREALEAVAQLVSSLALAMRGASALTLVVATLVLGGALAAGHRQRLYDAVILKTVGATRARLIGAYALEYLALALATAVFGVAAGSAAAAFVVRNLMSLSFVWLPGPALTAALAAVAATVALGLIGTFTALGQRPGPVLRHL